MKFTPPGGNVDITMSCVNSKKNDSKTDKVDHLIFVSMNDLMIVGGDGSCGVFPS